MSTEIWGALGIIVAVIFGVAAFFVAKKVWRNNQSQNVDRGGTGYQAGRDINVDKKP